MNKIIDKSLEPYSVHIDEDNYAVVKYTSKVRADGRSLFKTDSYHSKLRSAVKRIVRLKAVNDGSTESLNSYVERVERVAREIIDRLSI